MTVYGVFIECDCNGVPVINLIKVFSERQDAEKYCDELNLACGDPVPFGDTYKQAAMERYDLIQKHAKSYIAGNVDIYCDSFYVEEIDVVD